MSTANNKYLWWLCPLKGLRISNRQASFDKPMFNDATLLSKECVIKILSEVRSPHAEFLNQWAKETALRPNTGSFLAIRTPEWGEPEKSDVLMEKRLDEAMSEITLIWTERQNYTSSCGPVDRVFEPSKHVLGFQETTHDWRAKSSNEDIFYFSNDDPVKRSDILAFLKKSKLNHAMKIKYGNFHPSFKKALTSVFNRLAMALYSNTAGEIVAAVVTCIEILLHPTASNEKATHKRINVIVGFEKNVVDELYLARNAWIHQGVQPSSKLARSSVVRLFNLLDKFSTLISLSPPATTHEELLQWIDLQVFVLDQRKPESLVKLWKHHNKMSPMNLEWIKNKKQPHV